MALSFPLSASQFFELAGVKTVAFNLRQMQEVSSLGTGEIRAADLAPARFEAEIETVPMLHGAAEAKKALLNSLRGAVNGFYLYPVTLPYPQADSDGNTYGSSAPTVSARTDDYTLSIAGLPGSYEITAGDYLSIVWSASRTYLGQFVANATASGTGALNGASVAPALPAGVASSDAVSLAKPQGLFRLVPGSVHASSINPLMQSLKFTAIQSHEAA